MPNRAPVALLLLLALFAGACGGDGGPGPAPTHGPTATASHGRAGQAGAGAAPSPTAARPPAKPGGKPAKPGGKPAAPPKTVSRPGPTKPDLAAIRAARHSTGVRAVALTFDDGPQPTWTPRVLDYLKSAQVKATFCLIGVKAQEYPQLVARIVREGHTLCNHSWSHDLRLGRQSPAAIRADLLRTNDAIHKAAPGAPIKFFRQPGGEWTTPELAVVKELGMSPLHWAVDPQDWRSPGKAAIVASVEHHAHPGAIVLMHDGGGNRSGTVAACPAVIPWLKQRYGLVQLR
ncbi:polysaccharide deacetylase family protein [Plantactinospora siamensis]|uniref:Polysaccharide deacetylase family protein n=1 Tax=Plantactinospora siamensis TaxID=555372 RepID=A0ABV6NRC7_9ACTN